jgi:hypothetical protein
MKSIRFSSQSETMKAAKLANLQFVQFHLQAARGLGDLSL